MEKQISSLILKKNLNHHDRAFNSDCLNDKLRYILKLLRKIEENRDSLCNIIVKTPEDNNALQETQENINRREEECLIFLKNLIKNAKNQKISQKDVSNAYAYLGMAYELGAFGLAVDYKKAYYNYVIGFRNGSGMGAFRLAIMYEKGNYEKKSFPRALVYYKCAAKMGLLEGAHTYGMILYYTEDDSVLDYQTGLDFIKFAMVNATPEYPYAYFDLARIFEFGNSEIDLDVEIKYSYKLYIDGAELGCPNCCYRLGRAFERGELNRNVNWQDAIRWYKYAASLGQVDAQMALSSFYITGIDRVLDLNYEEAYKWTLRAAITGNPGAAYSLGGYIEQGIGIKKDPSHALWWYSISGLYGNKNAKYKIEKLTYQISQTPAKKKKWWMFCC